MSSFKQGMTPQAWQENPRKNAQKDKDVRKGAKGMKRVTYKEEDFLYPDLHTGYKLHESVDLEHKLIRKAIITPANVFDGHIMAAVLDPHNQEHWVYADKIYATKANRELLLRYGYIDKMLIKKPRGKALSPQTRALNNKRSKRRGRCEHVFGDMKGRGFKFLIRTIGYGRAQAKLLLTVISYNFRRIWSLCKKRRLI